jgi:cyclophilin family peptidyl-prolyl cis-trans isomerase
MPTATAVRAPRRRSAPFRRFAAAAVVAASLACSAHAQLTPDRTYYGINRPVPMQVALPADLSTAEGPADPRIHLLEPVTARSVAEAPVKPGGVDMAALFPTLWTSPPRLLYAQLFAGQEPVGPAVVLQPMVTPPYAVRVDAYGDPDFKSDPPRERIFTGLRAYSDRFVVLDTTKGPITIALRPDAAPNTVWNFRLLVEGGFYTDIPFHRVVSVDARGHPFLIQTGDPVGTGAGGPGYQVDLEPSTLPHDFGVVSMARSVRDPNTAGSQFFIALSREGTAPLDGAYAAFGQCVGGAEAIAAIAAVPIAPPTDQRKDRPLDPPVIRSARLVEAPPYGRYPPPVSPPGTGPIRK